MILIVCSFFVYITIIKNLFFLQCQLVLFVATHNHKELWAFYLIIFNNNNEKYLALILVTLTARGIRDRLLSLSPGCKG